MRDRRQSRRTAVDDSYPSCERTCARLLIYSGELSPDAVSSRLGLSATSMVRKGEVTTNSLGRTRVGRLNGWFLSSESHIVSKDVRRHLGWLLDVLEPVAPALGALQEEAGMTMAVDCIWWSKSGQGGPTLWPEEMSRLAALNLECSFDVSFYGEDERDKVANNEHSEGPPD